VGIEGSGPVSPLKPFKFWFTSSSRTSGLTQARKDHMKAVEEKVDERRQGHTARMLAPKFLKEGHFEVPLS
jgi:hypothetical protein